MTPSPNGRVSWQHGVSVMAQSNQPIDDARAAAIQAALAELRAEYAEGLSVLISELFASVETACLSSGGTDVRYLQTLAHRMHGAAGSYGFKGVSAAAAKLELLLVLRDDDHAAFDPVLRDSVRAAFAEIRDTALRELADFASSVPVSEGRAR